MLRTLFAPRLILLHLLVIGVLVAFMFLGQWQLGVFQASGAKPADDPAPVPVTQLSQVGRYITKEQVNRQVTATGEYVAGDQLLVADRVADVTAPGGRAAKGKGYWLLTPLRLEDGTLVPVVRGWVPTPTDPAVAVPDGTVTVTGRLRASEETGDVVPSGPLPEGQVALVSTAELINLWTDAPLRSGFIVAASQDPPLAAKPVAAPRPMEDVGFSWRNLAYAVQWWIFAGFAVFMWYHFVREAVRSDQRRRQAAVGREPAATEPTG